MDKLISLDKAAFHAVNWTFTNPFLDWFMPFVTEKSNFIVVVIAVAALIAIKGNRKDRWGLVLLLVTVLTSDFVCNILKHALMRVRPCNAIDGVRLLVGCGHSYSLPSGHATNIFAAMVFLTTRYKRYFPVLMTIAIAVSYSRVYVGVHYPLDVITGAALGTIAAIVIAEIDRRYLWTVVENFRKPASSGFP
jgi:undecaprenyl-diphosphatase